MKQHISTSTSTMQNRPKKARQTNIEVLRIIAMLMIMGLHVNFAALKGPSWVTITTDGVTRGFLEQFCLCSVNLFVLISGWFGIKAGLKGFCSLMWQVIFCVGLMVIVGIFTTDETNIQHILSIFGLFGGGGWFTAAYIGLYIISPVLNTYIEKTPKERQWLVVIAFFTWELLFGATKSAFFLHDGYSLSSFIGLYLFAGLVRRSDFQIRRGLCLLTFLACILINTLVYIVTMRYKLYVIADVTMSYYNPLTILEATALLLCFSKVKPLGGYAGKFVNLFARSSFAVYLLHCGNHVVWPRFLEIAKAIYTDYSDWSYWWRILSLMIGVYLCATLIDQFRILIWNKALCRIFVTRNNLNINSGDTQMSDK